MKNEELRSMVREIVREELANCLRSGLGVLEYPASTAAHLSDGNDDEAAVNDAFTVLEQHSDVMASWMRWAEDEADETDWQDFGDF